MAISEADIAAVRAATDIVALISEHVALRKVGRRWTGLCPFHAERTPSFSVNAEEGRYYCFGCRAAGDAITFVRETQHVDFVDAVRLLADRAHVEIHEDPDAARTRRERQALYDAMERAVSWYHDRLLHDPAARPAREYLRSRGIGGEVARRFRLGWAPDDWDALTRALDLSPAVLEGTGLGFVNRRGRRQDALRARVIFPIFDTSGRAIAVGGRILPGAPVREGAAPEPKYKNSPETSIYSKRRVLYALNWAKDDVIRSGEIVVCEGYTDVIAVFGAGVERAVATCGTALGEEHFRTMRNFAQRIVLAYDADSAGQSAAASVYQWERQHEVDVAVAKLPRGLDPAELAQRDPEALRRAVGEAVPFLEFRLDRALESVPTATPEGRARAAEAAVAVLAEHPSELVRDQYAVRVADRLRLDVTVVRADLAARLRGEAPVERSSRRVSSGVPRGPRPGLEALRVCVHTPERRERFVSAYFTDAHQRAAFEALGRASGLHDALDLLQREGEDAAAAILNALVVDEPLADDAAAVRSLVAQLLRSVVPGALRDLEHDLSAGLLDPMVAHATVRDVKERLALLDGPDGDSAEAELREWLVGRARS